MRAPSLLLTAAGLMLTGCTAWQGTPAVPAPGPSAPATAPAAWPAVPVDCAALAPWDASAGAPQELPAGIARLTLCNEPEHPLPLPVPPPDALVVGADAVAAVFSSLAPVPADQACTEEFGPAFRLVAEYPDGRRVELRGELYGCRVVGGRVGAGEVVTAFAEALRAQRVTVPVTVADPLVGLTCTDTAAWVRPATEDAVAAFACTGPVAEQRQELTADQWATLRADLAARVRELSPAETWPACEEPLGPVLVAVAATGEPWSIPLACGVAVFDRVDPAAPADEQGLLVWEPGPEAEAVLATLG